MASSVQICLFALIIFTAGLILFALFQHEKYLPALVRTSAIVATSPQDDNDFWQLPQKFIANVMPKNNIPLQALAKPDLLKDARFESRLIFCIKSQPFSINRRMVIRQTWGKIKSFQRVQLNIIFILGIYGGYEKQVIWEASMYKDILMLNISDATIYQPRKVLKAFQWITQQEFSNTDTFVMTEDTCVVNIAETVNYIKTHTNDVKQSILCGFMFEKNAGVIRGNGKRSVFKSHYSLDVYPPYCTSQLVILNKFYIAEIYKVSTVTNISHFHLDDILLYGILREKLHQKQSIKNVINGGKSLVYYPYDNSGAGLTKMVWKWRRWELEANYSNGV